MYDTTGIDSNVVITIPGTTGTPVLGTAADPFPAPMPQTTNASGDEFVSVSRVTGSVQFANPNQRIIADPAAAAVTIDITRMEYNSTVTLSYRKVDVNPGLTTNQVFTATTTSSTTADATIAFDPAADHVRTIAGSGTITISPEIVPMNSRQNLVFTYKAATALADATLAIAQPAAPWTALTLVTGSANAQEDNYVTVTGGDTAVDLTTTTGSITLSSVDLAKNASLTVRINRAQLAPDGTAIPAGAYGWATTLAGGGNTAEAVGTPTLYVVNVNDDVDFEIIPIPDPATNPVTRTAETLPHYPAENKEVIQFPVCTLGTPIKGGKVQFRIPNGWAATLPSQM